MAKIHKKSHNVCPNLSIQACRNTTNGSGYFMRVRIFGQLDDKKYGFNRAIPVTRDNYDAVFREAIALLVKLKNPRRVRIFTKEILAMQPDWDDVLHEIGVTEEIKYVYN